MTSVKERPINHMDKREGKAVMLKPGDELINGADGIRYVLVSYDPTMTKHHYFYLINTSSFQILHMESTARQKNCVSLSGIIASTGMKKLKKAES